MNIKYLKPAKTDITTEANITNKEFAYIEYMTSKNEEYSFEFHQDLKDDNGVVVAKIDTIYNGYS